MSIIGLLFLVVFTASLLASKATPTWVTGRVERLLMPTVIALVFTVSMWGSGQLVGVSGVINLVYYSLLYAALASILSYLIGLMIGGLRGNGGSRPSLNLSITLVVTLIIGWVLGSLIHTPYLNYAVEVELMVLAVMVGLTTGRLINLNSLISSGRVGLLSTASALAGSAVTGVALSYLLRVRLNVSLAISLGMGWYTYTGPMVALYASPSYGVLAFLANFIREQLTFIMVPLIPGCPEALISIGGATSMDDTLPVYVTRLGRDYSLASVTSGLLLTVLVPIIVPLALSL